MYWVRRRYRYGVSIAVAGAVLLLCGAPGSASNVTASFSSGTFINSNSSGNSSSSCGYMVIGNGQNAGNTASSTLYGLFKPAVPYMRGREIITGVTTFLEVMTMPGGAANPFATCSPLGRAQGVGNSYQLCHIFSDWSAVGGCEVGHTGGAACSFGQPTWDSPICSAGTGWGWNCLSGTISTGTAANTFYSGSSSCTNVGNSWCSAVQYWADGNTNNGFLIWAPANRGQCFPQYFWKNMFITFSYNCKAGYGDTGGGSPYCDPCTGSLGGGACVTGQSGNTCSDSFGNSNPGYTCSCANAAYRLGTATVAGVTSPACVNKDECTFSGSDPCKAQGDSAASCADIGAPSPGHNCTCSTASGFSVSNQGTSSATCVANCPAPAGQNDPCSAGGSLPTATCTPGAVGTWACNNCPNGYRSSGGNQPTCQPFDACFDVAHGAVGGTRCKHGLNGNSCGDLGGSSEYYDCTCGTGYTDTGGNTPQCLDTNECMPNHCIAGGDNTAVCTDHVAPLTGYDCKCSNDQYWVQGNAGGGFNGCIDKDECASPSPFPCVHGACGNLPTGGGYACGCESGFVTSGGKSPICIHPDSCNDQAKLACVVLAGNTCVDDPPPKISYTCDCSNPAYTLSLDGHSCVDKNACATDHCGDEGDRGADCVDHRAPKAGYECECSKGWTFDGTSCIDVNECVSGSNPCGHGSCSNTKGSYQCTCASGFALSKSTGKCVSAGALNADNIEITTTAGSDCGCRVGGAPGSSGPLAFLLLGLAILWRRQRRGI